MHMALDQLTPAEFRKLIRQQGAWAPSSSTSKGYVQANFVVLPSMYAGEFLEFCSANPAACPVIWTGKPGQWEAPELGQDIDLRTDVGKYLALVNGTFSSTLRSIEPYWNNDLIPIAIGCSFSFESALIKAGIQLRHISESRNVAMYKTNIRNKIIGRFSGNLVVSMRPIPSEQIDLVIRITEQLPDCHGAPIHIGAPSAIGILDLLRPDFGDSTPIRNGETPVFWACGVTSQTAIESAGLDLAYVHSPGHMLLTDWKIDD
jgi:uncharacterized protein YcsI (UPF0317 family)